jgi:hypothetical protein
MPRRVASGGVRVHRSVGTATRQSRHAILRNEATRSGCVREGSAGGQLGAVRSENAHRLVLAQAPFDMVDSVESVDGRRR